MAIRESDMGHVKLNVEAKKYILDMEKNNQNWIIWMALNTAFVTRILQQWKLPPANA